MENTREIKCKNCGKIFTTPIKKDGGSLNFFCSEACVKEYDELNPKYVKCKNCGKDIRVYHKGLTRFYETKTYCSLECSREYIKNHPRVKNEKGEIKQICEKCGKEFYAKYRRKYCDDCVVKTSSTSICAYCGKEFENPKSKNGYYNTSRKYCSVECMHKASCTRVGRKLICEKCGKEFDYPINCDGDRYVVKFCPDCAPKPTKQFGICQICGKQFEYPKKKNGGGWENKIKYCSDECRAIGQRQNLIRTLNAKYGKNVNHPFQIPGILDRFKATMNDKYGVDYACQLDDCIKLNKHTISHINKDFADLLDKLNILYDMEYNLDNNFYDFCIKDKNILIEINPNYTHTVAGNHYNHFEYNAKYENYHLSRTKLANENGYRCIHIWQWDDWNKVVLMLRDKQKLYARKLQLKEITKQEANQFLNLYHLQNACRGNSVNLGLYQDDQLIQVMTFGKPRYNKNYQWELLRLCTNVNYYVVGGAERLFKHFLKQYNPESIISYCDISKFTGDVYERLGFKLKEQTKPQKIWGKSDRYKKDYITDNLLRQRGADQLIGTHDGKGTSNEEIMLREGWLPVYDCGQKVFEYKRGDNLL